MIIKNYLTEKELKELGRIVSMYLDYAEMQANNRKIMNMKDWITKLDAFLDLNEKEILKGTGNVSHLEMEKTVRRELEKYNRRKYLPNQKPPKKLK